MFLVSISQTFWRWASVVSWSGDYLHSIFPPIQYSRGKIPNLHWEFRRNIPGWWSAIQTETVFAPSTSCTDAYMHANLVSRTLRSSADNRIFRIPNRRRKFQGQRAFSFIGPSVWNNLPFSVRLSQTWSFFKSQLWTQLFSVYYS